MEAACFLFLMLLLPGTTHRSLQYFCGIVYTEWMNPPSGAHPCTFRININEVLSNCLGRIWRSQKQLVNNKQQSGESVCWSRDYWWCHHFLQDLAGFWLSASSSPSSPSIVHAGDHIKEHPVVCLCHQGGTVAPSQGSLSSVCTPNIHVCVCVFFYMLNKEYQNIYFTIKARTFIQRAEGSELLSKLELGLGLG